MWGAQSQPPRICCFCCQQDSLFCPRVAAPGIAEHNKSTETSLSDSVGGALPHILSEIQGAILTLSLPRLPFAALGPACLSAAY